MSSGKDLFNFPFSHIYVEKKVIDHPLTKSILARYGKSAVISIDHYKDVFNRRRQSYGLQKTSPSLILARKNNCRSIAFPVISSGIYGYPKREAWLVAVRACCDFIEKKQ